MFRRKTCLHISRHLGKHSVGIPHNTALHLSQHKCYQAKPWHSTVQWENQGRGANPMPPLCCATWVWLKRVWKWFKLMLSVSTIEIRILSLKKIVPIKAMQCLPLLPALFSVWCQCWRGISTWGMRSRLAGVSPAPLAHRAVSFPNRTGALLQEHQLQGLPYPDIWDPSSPAITACCVPIAQQSLAHRAAGSVPSICLTTLFSSLGDRFCGERFFVLFRVFLLLV